VPLAGRPAKLLIAVLLFAGLASASPAIADLLGPNTGLRELPFEVVDGKPMIAASVGETPGAMMFDTGTPDAVFLNRDALRLDDGTVLAEGRAASGQTIEVRQHDAPPIRIAGEDVAIGPAIRSGNFGFTAELLGDDFLGFIGRPAVEESAFVLDYGRQVLTVLSTEPDGSLPMPPPPDADVLARIDFVLSDHGLPMSSARIGAQPVTVDLDTGDGGTIYLRDETRARLMAEGLLSVEGDRGRIAEVGLGEDAVVRDLFVRLVRAGSTEDARDARDSDLLRLGAAFFARQVTVWNYPGSTIHILRPGVSYP